MRNVKKYAVLFSVVLIMFNFGSASAQNWPAWRGPNATGAAPKGNPPTEWSETQNIKWKVEIAGKGFSTPAIWGDDVFVTTAISEEGEKSGRAVKVTSPVKFIVMALDRKTGKVKWEKLAVEELPHEARHPSGTWATASPVTNGKRLYAFFGSRGLFCYTIEGELLWKKDFGDMKINNEFGEGASPALYENTLVVNWDHMGDSFIVALDAVTGEELWRNERSEERTSWMTPLIVEVNGRPQVIATATYSVRAYDLETGDTVWEGEGLTRNVIPSPVEANGIAYLMSGYAGNVTRAVRLKDAKGDITGTPAILWEYNQDTPYTPSPLLMGGMLYFLKNNNGILTCLDVSTGKANFSNQRLEGIKGVYSSPVGVNDKVYILGRKGVTLVLKQGTDYNVIASNTLEDKFDSSPAIAGNEIFLRGYKYLYCIAK